MPSLRDVMALGFVELERHAGTRIGQQDALSCYQLDIHAPKPLPAPKAGQFRVGKNPYNLLSDYQASGKRQ
jgi:hypothetical protein